MGTASATWQDYSVPNSGSSLVSSTKLVDLPPSTIENDSWCNAYPSITSVLGGSVADGFCYLYDGVTRNLPLTPPSITSDTGLCTDLAPPLIYSVDHLGADQDHVTVSVDSDNNLIYLTPMASGSDIYDLSMVITA